MNTDDFVNRKFVITISIKEQLEYKRIENCSLDELIIRLPNVDEEIIKLVYGYLHKGKTTTAYNYASKNNISESYLYKIVKEIKNQYTKSGEADSDK